MSTDTTLATADDFAAAAPTPDIQRVQQFAAKVAGDLGLAHNSVLAYLGDRLGLWAALAAQPGTTSAQLARRLGLVERYVREWLAAQAAAGYVEYDPVAATFTLPVEHAMVFADEQSPAFMAPGFEVVAAVWATVDQLAHGYATGQGLGWHEHDTRLFRGFERFFRNVYVNSLVAEWLSAVPGLVDKLTSGVRVLDVGCGLGTATVLMAQAFPASNFIGIDIHDESIRRARLAAAEAGVADRVAFETGHATSYPATYDVICLFDTLHDLGDPVGALAHARAHLVPGGQLVAVEPNAGDHLEENLHPLGLTWYASGHSLCVPNALSQGGDALGAQAGPTKMLGVFKDAGFTNPQLATRTVFNMVIQAQA